MPTLLAKHSRLNVVDFSKKPGFLKKPGFCGHGSPLMAINDWLDRQDNEIAGLPEKVRAIFPRFPRQNRQLISCDW